MSLIGKVVDSRSLRPEVNCLISVDGQEVYSDAEGNFTLESVRSGSDLRIRFRCRGLIERHVIRVPGGSGVVQLSEPVVIGRSLHGAQGSAGQASLRSTFSTAVEDLRQMPPSAREAEPTAQDSSASAPTTAGAAAEAQSTATSSATLPAGALPSGEAAGLVPETRPAQSPTPQASTQPAPATTAPQPLVPPNQSGYMRSYDRLSVQPDEKIEGSLSAAQIHPELRRRVLAFYSCYADFLESDPMNRIHHMRVRWTIEPNGTVSSAELLRSTERDAEKNQCLVRRVTRLSFPQATDKTVVERTFIFGFRLDPMAQIP